MIDRRGFLSSITGVAGAAGVLGLPPKWNALLEQEAPKLPDSALYGSNEEAYWTEWRKQFVIPADEVYLNNGTVGSCPMPVPRAAAALNLINDAITPRTRVLFFSHITTVTGVVLPAKELCALARSKGIFSAVDGAHVVGMMRLNVHELGCDMYTSSPHKWLQAPQRAGLLYVRDAVIDRLWNTIVTAGWDEPKLRAERFQRIGSSNVPALWGL